MGSNLYNTACKGVLHNWANNDQITDKQLALAISELPEFNTLTRPLSDQMKADYVMYVNTLAAGDWAAKIERPGVGTPYENDDFFNSIAYWLANEPNVSCRLLKIHFSQLLEASDDSINQNTSTTYQLKYMSVEELDPLVKGSVFGQEFPGMYENLFRAIADDKARQAVLTAFLSVYRFKLANGNFPQSIDELKTTYANISFIDPNSALEDQMLGYRIDQEKLLVWSVGRNGTNEHGNITRGYDQGTDVGFEILLKPTLDSSADQQENSNSKTE